MPEKWPRGGAFAHPVGFMCGAFEQLFRAGGQKSKNSNAQGVARGRGDVEVDRH